MPAEGPEAAVERPANSTCVAPPANADGSTAFPTLLSQTGCFKAGNMQEPASGLIPYEVNSPLWSDGASKRRWIALPDGAVLSRRGVDGLTVPPGTVLLKEFTVGSSLLETRMLTRRTDGQWGAATYRWNAARTDATLVGPDWQAQQVGDVSWTYFGQSGCLFCHSEAAGRALGMRIGQLNKDVEAQDGAAPVNQVALWRRLGLFDASVSESAVKNAPRLADPHGNDSVSARARSYLEVNCSSCHTPGGRFDMGFNFDLESRLENMGLCSKSPGHGTLGVPDARLLVPGAPQRSLISLRMHSVGANRMPRFGSGKVDTTGTALIDAWISSLPPDCKQAP
ncbi:MAG TPA: hypothetical protein VFH51_12685 [Myxococcota bacterium]|nr:hypothetical protein [Myxococcota bacterium]